MWMLGHKPRSSTRAASALNNGVSLQPTTCTLISTFLRRNFWRRDHHLSVPYCKLGYWDWNRLTNMPRVKPKVAQARFENKPPWYCSLAYFLPLVTKSALIPGLDMYPCFTRLVHNFRSTWAWWKHWYWNQQCPGRHIPASPSSDNSRLEGPPAGKRQVTERSHNSGVKWKIQSSSVMLGIW